MAERPQIHTIAQVTGSDKIVIQGFDGELDVLPKGHELTEGQEVKGWLNPEGKFGPYLKLAEDRPNGSQARPAGSSGQQRDDATGRSIERQVSAKIAGELIGPIKVEKDKRPEFAEHFHFLTDTIHDAIKGE